MQVLFLVIQIILAILLVAIILLQRSDSDGASALSGNSNMMGGMMGYKSANVFLVRVTAVLMLAFFINSIILGNLAQRKANPISLLTNTTNQVEASPKTAEPKHKSPKDNAPPIQHIEPRYPDDFSPLQQEPKQ